jgi:RNA-directed DNA polymerase
MPGFSHRRFSYGTRDRVFNAIERYVCDRVRAFLARRHKVAGRSTKVFPWTTIYGGLGVLRLRTLKTSAVGRI